MSRHQKVLRSRTYHYVLACMLFMVAMMGVLSACGSGATLPPAKGIPSVYVVRQDGLVDALKPSDGSLRWHQQLDKQPIQSYSLKVFNTVVYVGRANHTCSANCVASSKVTGSIDALNASNGAVLWHSKVDGHNGYPPSVQVLNIVNDVVYVAVDAGFSNRSVGDVYALRANDGSQLWHRAISGGCCRGLVVTDAVIYIGELDHVDAIKTGVGTLLWHHQIDSPSVLTGIAVVDEVVYVGIYSGISSGHLNGSVDALRANDGTVLWHHQTNFASSVLTVAGGVVYVGAVGDNKLDALRVSDGSLLWQYKSGDRSVVQATIMDGVAYLTSVCALCFNNIGSTVDALRVSDGSRLWHYYNPGAVQVVVATRMVYVYGSMLHGIVALDATSGNKGWFYAAENVVALAVDP